MNDPRNPIRFGPASLEAAEAPELPGSENDSDKEGVEEETPLTHKELAWEFVEVLEELGAEEMAELVEQNVPQETREFFARYAGDFAEGLSIDESTRKRLPNLMMLGYLLRLLEDRLITDPAPFDA